MNSSITKICLIAHEFRRHRPTPIRILAIDLNYRGFGFALYENMKLVDWGLVIVSPTKRRDQSLERFRLLLRKYHPDRVVLEDLDHATRRSEAARTLSEDLRLAAIRHGCVFTRLPWRRVARYWSDHPGVTRYDVASGLVSAFPELKRHLPRPRRCWVSQDLNLSIFNAAAVGLAFLCNLAKRSS